MHRRTTAHIALVIMALVLALAALAACGGDDDENDGRQILDPFSIPTGGNTSAQTVTSAAAPADMMLMADEEMAVASADAMAAGGAPGMVDGGGALQPADRKIISTGSITVEVEDVQSAVTAVEALVDSMGGYVEVLSRSGAEEHSRASLTIRVPQGQFASAYDRIRALGAVLQEHQGSEDVSEQFIDLEARLNSAKREEQSFLSLLSRTTNVGEVLTIERELARVRADIERYQGQLDFLSRRVDLSTIYVELVPEPGPFLEPPVARLTVAVDDVRRALTAVQSIIRANEGDIRFGVLEDFGEGLSADIDARVFSDDFRAVINEIERLGDVQETNIREPVLSPEGGEERRPTAEVSVFLVEPDYTTYYVIGAVAVLAVLLAIVITLGVRRMRGGRGSAAAA